MAGVWLEFRLASALLYTLSTSKNGLLQLIVVGTTKFRKLSRGWTTAKDIWEIYENDGDCNFEIVTAKDIDAIGMVGIIEKIKDRVGIEACGFVN